VTRLVAALFAAFLALTWLPAGAQTQTPADRADKASAAEKKADRKAERDARKTKRKAKREARKADRKANSAIEQK
jgi:uncharacterized membrane protein